MKNSQRRHQELLKVPIRRAEEQRTVRYVFEELVEKLPLSLAKKLVHQLALLIHLTLLLKFHLQIVSILIKMLIVALSVIISNEFVMQ